VRIYTIGFTKKSAEQFFGLLAQHGIRRVVDIRLRPQSQLAGFAKQPDLQFFLRALLSCDYIHLKQLAPSDALLSTYRKDKDWASYERDYARLMDERGVDNQLDPSQFMDGPTCLLCSEHLPDRCHRRLLAERLAQVWKNVEVVHLM